MSKTKKILLISGITLDVAITVFFFVISIIMIVKSVTIKPAEIQFQTGLIGYLLNHLNVYLGVFVIPMFILLGVNIFALIRYIKKGSAKKEKVTVNDLSEEQKEALRKELLKDLQNK